MRKPIQTIKERLADEIGSHFQHGPKRVAMLYPSPYKAGDVFAWIPMDH